MNKIEKGDRVVANRSHTTKSGGRNIKIGEAFTVREIVTFAVLKDKEFYRFVEFINPIHDYGMLYGTIEIIYSAEGFELIEKGRTAEKPLGAVYDYAEIARRVGRD